MFIRSLQAKCAKFHTRDGPGKGRSHYKELHCQVPLPAAPWSSFQLLESVEAPGQKPRDNAFKDGDTSRKEAGEETQETPWKGLWPARGRSRDSLRPPVHTAFQEHTPL